MTSKNDKESKKLGKKISKNSNSNNGGWGKKLFMLSIILISSIFIFSLFMPKTPEKVSNQDFLRNLEKGKYSEVTVTNQVTSSGLVIEYKEKDTKTKKGKKKNVTILNSDKTKDEIISSADKSKTKVFMDNPSNNANMLFSIMPMIMSGFLIYFVYKSMSGGLMGGKNNKSTLVVEKSKVTFKDVAGKDEEKEELMDVIKYFNNPEEYNKRKIKNQTGILLEGPPGTGKTLLAKALAGETNASYFYMSGADFNGMFRGSGTNQIKSLFNKARENAPSIVFIDEIDALAKRRMGGINDRDSEQTLNQLLTELDGFQGIDEQVVVLGATNLADSLDPAVLRSGRFDRKIYVGLPNKYEREQILKYYVKDLILAKDVDINSLGEQIQGFSGADIEGLVNEANLGSFNNGRTEITSDDFEKAFNKVIVGVEKKSTVYTQEQKVIVANHESGHALVGALLEGAKKVKKVTIIPHGRAGGFAMMLPKDEMFVQTKDYLENTIVTLLAGRGAEEILSNTQTTGVSQDIKEATEIAKGMIANYGMEDSFQYRSPEDFKSEELSKKVDDILNRSYVLAKEIINNNLQRIKLLSEVLQTKETLYEKEIDYIVSLDNEHIEQNYEEILNEIINRDFEKSESKNDSGISVDEQEDDIYEKDNDDKKPVVVNKEDTGLLIKEALSNKQKVEN